LSKAFHHIHCYYCNNSNNNNNYYYYYYYNLQLLVLVYQCMWICAVRRREDVAEACLKPSTSTCPKPPLVLNNAPAVTKPPPPPLPSSSLAKRSRVVAAPVPSTSAWSVPPQPATSAEEDTSSTLSLFDMARGVAVGTFYCDYCNVFCNSETQLDAHCASAKHKLNISSDCERQWNFRPPPLTIANGQYTRCMRSGLLAAIYHHHHHHHRLNAD